MTGKVTAPRHLTAPTRRWYEHVCSEFDLESHHLRLLTLAAETWDRCQQARRLIARQGLVVADKWGQLKAHPAVAIERDSRVAFARLIRDLALDVSMPGESRPPAIVGNARLRVAEG